MCTYVHTIETMKIYIIYVYLYTHRRSAIKNQFIKSFSLGKKFFSTYGLSTRPLSLFRGILLLFLFRSTEI